jgi:CRP-like cAMP-binding protein
MGAELVPFLRTVEGFKSLADEPLARLAESIRVEAFVAGDYVVRRGEVGDRMFVVHSGQVQIPIVDERGLKQFTAQLTPGEIFGEMALLTGAPRNADVVALTDCRCLVLDRATVNEVMARHPDVAGFLTSILGARLMQTGGIRKVGKYRLVGELGSGGMSQIYEGWHPELDRLVAIKMLSHTLLYRRHFAERFRNEARIIAGLRHPNIVDVYDYEEAYATIFIIMEKLTGSDVERILDERGRMDPDDVRRIIRDTASALAYAHDRGIIHRDVKPSNIFIAPDGSVKLTDFGIASVSGLEERMTADAGMYLGTPVYTSPEHAMGLPVDARSDIYSLGIVAWEMLCGQPPFDADDSSQVLYKHVHEQLPDIRRSIPGITRDIEEFIVRATAKNPRDRFQTCHEIVEFFDGHIRRSTATRSVRVRTVTMIYTPDVEAEVETLMRNIQRLGAAVDGLVVKLG